MTSGRSNGRSVGKEHWFKPKIKYHHLALPACGLKRSKVRWLVHYCKRLSRHDADESDEAAVCLFLCAVRHRVRGIIVKRHERVNSRYLAVGAKRDRALGVRPKAALELLAANGEGMAFHRPPRLRLPAETATTS